MTRRELLRLLASGLSVPWAVPGFRGWSLQGRDGMKALADRAGVQWGVMMPAAHVATLLVSDPVYGETCRDNFNALAIPDFGWSKVEPEQDVWALGSVSAAADFAVAKGMKAIGMHLLWGHPSQVPAWLRRISDPQVLRERALKHVGAVVRAMRGRLAAWSVVNELDGAPWVAGSDFWRSVFTGGDLAEVFQRVREEDDKALLLLNDFGIEVPGGRGFMEDRRDRVLQLVKQLRSHSAPLGAIGFQMHINASDFAGDPSLMRRRSSLFRDNIRSFQDAGVQVCITELDVRVDEVRGSLTERLSLQADLYESMLGTALEAGVLSVTFWGLSDKYAIDMRTGQVSPGAGPLLFDNAMQGKPGYYAAERVLQRRVPS